MPLTPKDDVDESRVASDHADDEAREELRERVDDLDERTAIPMGLDTLDERAAALPHSRRWRGSAPRRAVLGASGGPDPPAGRGPGPSGSPCAPRSALPVGTRRVPGAVLQLLVVQL